MSLNFGIYWANPALEYASMPSLNHIIDSDNPNELFETGYREIYKPFPNEHRDDLKYKEMHQKLFADGPKLKFVASDKFVGSMYGYLYYMGDKGLGYYIDHLIMRHVYYR